LTGLEITAVTQFLLYLQINYGYKENGSIRNNAVCLERLSGVVAKTNQCKIIKPIIDTDEFYHEQ
jgi:hypothetical protein